MIMYCSLFQMDSNYQGDLTDILIAAGGGVNHHVNPSQDHDHDHHHHNQLEPQVNRNSEWHLLYPSDPMNCGDNFGDPFSTMRDPLFHHGGDNNFPEAAASSTVITGQAYDHDHATTTTIPSNNNILSHTTRVVNLHDDQDEDHMKRPCNIFSRMLQISPSSTSKLAVTPCDSSSMLVNSPAPVKSCANIVPTGNHVIISANTSNKGNSLVENNTGLQISSPRNPGIKRRKSQGKKVVCIPAPAAVSSRQTGEVVPSDLWAWRKYGQKPIKGSPYPRGYYRCSSSKGCSARKQVERSRTDPNMLVITYTSEHNHPWPTQRNALAGSTRLQPLKNSSAPKSSSLGYHHQKTAPNDDQEQDTHHLSDNNASNTNASVKEEIDDMEKQIERDDLLGEYITEKFPYGSNVNSDQDFFAELGEIDIDPLKLLFTQSFSENEQKDSKALDPFSLFDWAGDDNANANITPFDESKKGL